LLCFASLGYNQGQSSRLCGWICRNRNTQERKRGGCTAQSLVLKNKKVLIRKKEAEITGKEKKKKNERKE
jgi:hypothetical protein